MTLTNPTLESLAAITQNLEREVPVVRGSFPDFHQLGGQLLASGGKVSTYVLGTIKSGKSTFLSSLLAADVLPRGSGVKTFNIFRVEHGTARRAVVSFKSPAQLTAMLAFDFRMLGCDAKAPTEPFDRADVARVAETFARFEAAAAADGRLEAIKGRDESASFLALAYARVRHTLRSLDSIHNDFDRATVDQVRGRHELSYAGEAFENYLKWAANPEYAVLIHEIAVTLPFAPRLPEGLALVDCQGSDSLNPLDFAAVDAALHRADRIFYVVNSRLGLRLADRDLLSHVQSAGLAPKAAIILNVEAYEPLAPAELAKLVAKAKADLDALGLSALTVRPVNALLELFRETRPADLDVMRTMWTARGAASTFAAVEANYAALLAEMSQHIDGQEVASTARVLPILVQRAQTAAKALLARDRQVYGTQISELDENGIRLAIRRILDGERAELHKRLTKLAFDHFDKHGPVEAAIREFVKGGVARLLTAHPLPASMEGATRHGAVMVGATEAFNTEWTIFERDLRLKLIQPFIEVGFKKIMDSLSAMYRLIPGVLGAKLQEVSLSALPSATQVMNGLKDRLERAALAEPVPEVLRPVVLLPVIESGLAAEFYAKHFFELVKKKIAQKMAKPVTDAPAGQGSSSPTTPVQPDAANSAKVRKLWERTLTAAFKAGLEDQEFSVSSAKENFRFQYFGKIAEALFERFEEIVMTTVSQSFEETKRLTAASKLLLSVDDRQKIEEYLKAL